MTTVAYKDGEIAADSAVTREGTVMAGLRKTCRSTKGLLAGAAGDATFVHAFLAWVEGECEGSPPEALNDEHGTDAGIIIFPSGTIVIYEERGSYELHSDHYALGSGRDYALGAMAAGASPLDAVNIAIAYDPFSLGPAVMFRQ